MLGFRPKDPSGYGRLLTDHKGSLVAIREERDASDAEQRIGLCNSGVMAFRVPKISDLMGRIGNANAKSEFYLTDAVEIGIRDGLKAAVVECGEDEVLGVNARDQLAAAEAIWQARADVRREGIMAPPAMLRDAHYRGAADRGHGTGYVSPHDDPSRAGIDHLPEGLRGRAYYVPSSNGEEAESGAHDDRHG